MTSSGSAEYGAVRRPAGSGSAAIGRRRRADSSGRPASGPRRTPTKFSTYPAPPAAPEESPPAEAPQADAFWSPGYWAWQGGQFAWTPGFWTTGQPGWVWTPPCYSWTPRGYALVSGYWDYTLDRRGLAFSPLAIGPAIYGRPGFVYTPAVAIDPGIFTFYLFARPRWCNYYFGDYFAEKYDRFGFYPWYAVGHGGLFYDPLFAYDHWYYANRDPHWIENLQRWHSYYRAHPDARPPHNYAEQARFVAAGAGRADHRYLTIGEPLSKAVHNADFPVHLARVSAAERTSAMNIARSHRDFQSQRSRVETGGLRTTGPAKVTLPHPTHPIAPAAHAAARCGPRGSTPAGGESRHGATRHSAVQQRAAAAECGSPRTL